MSGTELLRVRATMVADEFIDHYMPDAGGDYVKVYLYFLRNRESKVSVASAAEALRLTEGDIRRAVRYWVDKGVLAESEDKEGTKSETPPAKDRELRARYMSADGRPILDDLGSDTEFAQLLVIIQKYMSRILTERDQEVFAYLYDGLKLPADVIEYLVEYAVETGHNSVRYIEKTGLDWADLGIRDVARAKERTDQFDDARTNMAKKRKKKSPGMGITRDDDLDSLVRVKLGETLDGTQQSTV